MGTSSKGIMPKQTRKIKAPSRGFRLLIYLQDDDLLPTGYQFKDKNTWLAELVEIHEEHTKRYFVEDVTVGLNLVGRGTTVRRACREFLEIVVDNLEMFQKNRESYTGQARRVGERIEGYIEKAA